MKIFRRKRKWIRVYTQFMTAVMMNAFRQAQSEVKIILEVKEKRDKTYEYRCYASHPVSKQFMQHVDLDYIIKVSNKEEKEKLKAIIKKYNLELT